MVGIDRRLLQNVDWPLVGATLGLVTLSASTLATVSVGRTGGGVAIRQLAWFCVGLFALMVVASIDYRRLVQMAPLLYIGGLAGLVAVFFLGRTVSGARRWVLIGPLSVQPSEMFKLCFVLMAVWLVTSRWAQPVGKIALIMAAPVALIPAVLIVKQPDLGTALTLLPVAAALIIVGGARWRHLGMLAGCGLAVLPAFWFLLRDYQRERILVYVDPSRDPLGSAWNVIQAKITIGSGQLAGKGLFGGTQSRLAFLPERHTDFVFAAFAESWGFLGAILLLFVYVLLVLRGFEVAASARDTLGSLLATGATVLLATQALINLGMVTGLLPVVGIPLPFVSYGGSALLTAVGAVALIANVRMRRFA